MKQVQKVIPLVLLLIVGSTAITPALAAKEKGEKIEYTMAGTIWDSDKESTGTGELDSEQRREIYLWNTDTNEWEKDRDEIYTESWTWSYSGTESELSISFSGKIQSKGRPPLKGSLSLYDYKQVVDGYEYHWASVSGVFGPYSLSAGTGYLIPVPPPVR